MLLSEFEELTGIYPDTELYAEIQREYENGEWTDKDEFCHHYKNNVYNLAEKIQNRVNEKLWKKEDKHRRTADESARRIQELHGRCIELGKQLAIKENALTFETISNTEAVRIMIEGVESILKRACGYVSEGFFDNGDLEKIKRFSECREELLRLQNKKRR